MVATEWFNDAGWMIGELPAECIADCHHQGACDADCAEWRKRLDFSVPRAQAIAYLKEFGAWDDLAEWEDDRLAETVLWIACGDIQESGEWLGLIH